MPECHSTNSLALELCQQSPPPAEGTVVITANQTAGRGQRGNTWSTQPGMNLTFSVILKPSFLAIRDQFYLNVFISLAVHDYLHARQVSGISIKWPNDIYILGKKVCGILIENQLQGQLYSFSVIGTGININQHEFELSSATSVSLALNRQFDLNEELSTLLNYIEARYLQLHNNKLEELMRDYRAALYWMNETHTFSSEGNEFEGIIEGVDVSGRLIVNDGNRRSFGLKEISYVR